LEAGPLSQWLYSGLAEAELPVVCVETRHMQARQNHNAEWYLTSQKRSLRRATFGELVRLSRTTIADEMREEQRRRVLGE
jgi:hypothetical protein